MFNMMSEVTFTEEESDEANMFGEERIAEFAPADVNGGDSHYPGKKSVEEVNQLSTSRGTG